MSGAKVAVVSPPLAPVIVGGAVTIGGVLIAGYLIKKGAEYGYVKVKFERLKSDFKDYIKEIKLREDELRTKYNLHINYSDKFKDFIDEIMKKYNASIYEMLSSEETDRKKIQQKISKIREELNKLRVELREIAKESDIYANIIDKLEQSSKLKEEFRELKELQKSIKNQTTITKRRAILVELKEKIESYESKAFMLFMQKSSSSLEEERFEEEHKSQELKREITLSVEKIKLLEPNYQFGFELDKESSRLELIKDEVKVAYAKIKKSKLLKDKLLELVRDIDNPDLNSKVVAMVSKSELTTNQYREMTQEINRYKEEQRAEQQRELIINNVIGGLKELGYEIVDEDIEQLKAQKEVLIDIDDEYKLKVMIKGNSYKIKFIKHVSDESEPTQNEQQRDMEVMSQWCGDYDKLLKFLAQNGLGVEHKIKLEPDMDDIEYVVVKAKNKKRKNYNSMANLQSR